MDGSPATQQQSETTLEREMRALAAALSQRDAENRAQHKAWRAAARACTADLASHQQQFQMWVGDVLNPAVCRANALLKPGKCTLTLTIGPWRRFCGPLPATEILTQSTVTFTREGSTAKHELTIAMYADGWVCAWEGTRAADASKSSGYPEAHAHALSGAYADKLVVSFVHDALQA